MQRVTIQNWTYATELNVRTLNAGDELPRIVLVETSAGPLGLHFGMHPAQARAMAAALIAGAEEIEGVTA